MGRNCGKINCFIVKYHLPLKLFGSVISNTAVKYPPIGFCLAQMDVSPKRIETSVIID